MDKKKKNIVSFPSSIDEITLFLVVRDIIHTRIAINGAVMDGHAMSGVCKQRGAVGLDDFTECIDLLIALGEIKAITPKNTVSQYRVYVSTRKVNYESKRND